MKRKDIVKIAKSLKGESGHRKVVEIYNAQKPLPQGYKMSMDKPWCATFVSAVFLENGCNTFSECSCPRMIEKAKKAGIWKESDDYKAQIADVVLYDWQDTGVGDDKGEADHVGVIIAVDDKNFTVREGNKSGTIGNRVLPINGKFIRGFITPKFSDKAETTPAPEKPQNEAPAKQEKYVVGKTYTINVRTALNVRTGAGLQYKTVGYNNLTPDGKKHAIGSALKGGTKVTCLQIKHEGNNIWMRIPSGWICAELNGTVYVK